MTIRKKVTMTAIAVSMLATSIGGFPLSQKGLAEKLGFVDVVNAAQAELPSKAFLEQLNKLHAALAAGDPVDVEEVRKLRDEIAALDEKEGQKLLDPIWIKISAKLPESVDQGELKASLFRIVKAVGSFQYDPGASNLEAIRTNPEFRSTLKTIAAASGDPNITIDDFLIFLFGDGGSLKGVEGTIRDQLSKKSSIELMALLGNKQGIMTVLLQSMEQLLGKTEDYKFSSILNKLGISPLDVKATVLNFQMKLKQSEPAINAMTVAYMRSTSQESVKISEDGRVHNYSLKVFGVDVPSAVLIWSKASGSSEVSVLPNGTVSIPAGTAKASAVIQAKLMNPYGGSAKVIFQKEVTLTGAGEEVEEGKFPSELFLARMNKLYAALAAGDPADMQDVRNLRDEIAGLDSVKDQALIAPLWNKIALKLPASADKAKLKTSLFEIIKAVGSIQYDPDASGLEAIRTNAEFRATLKAIAAAGGDSNLVMDDFLLFMFGDFKSLKGIEGTVRDKLASLPPTELMRLLGNNQEITALLFQAMGQLLGETEAYKLSSVMSGLGITPQDVMATVVNFQLKLKKAEPAINAMTIAYMRSESSESVKVSNDGRQHEYSLKVIGIDVPAPVLVWSKVSGSADVTVLPNGTVTLAKKVMNASAVIQAKLVNPYGGSAKVIFQKEVTLTAKESEGAFFPAEPFLERMAKVYAALEAGGSANVKDVRNLKNEIAGLNAAKDHAWIDQVWNKIAPNLPKSVDQMQLKKGFFEIIKAISSFQYAPTAAELEAMRGNKDFQATLKVLADAGGTANLTIDDILILMFGDGKELGGIEGAVRDTVVGMKEQDFAKLLRSKDNLNTVQNNAWTAVLAQKESYVLSEVLFNLGVKSTDVQSVIQKFKSKLKYEEKAKNVWNAAYVRASVVPTVKISDNGGELEYGLMLLGKEIPSTSLSWDNVTENKNITVTPRGKVTLSKKVNQGTVVIKATLPNAFGGSGQIIFQQEITLVRDNGGVIDPETAINNVMKALDVKIADITKRLKEAKNDTQKLGLIMDAIVAGNETATEINKVNASKGVKNKAINETRNKVNKVIALIIKDLMRF
ncbi:hypothetical protein FHS15_004690 [Paenibacillus castaneae]|uniref:hypothetical protein n=1 Tax=Paenibacillus castaneae TaxID=474957 RepID=UPI000C9A0CE3|nr:hypothetical protein [Paenibacillus castaneae]NIK79529.1 hypothetical protein [Paenibacillus castaneae]